MGSGSWSPSDWDGYTSSVRGKSADKIFTTSAASVAAHGIDKDLNPMNVAVRESRDSVDNPTSTALIAALDVTGSMGMIAHAMATESLGVLFKEILERKPISDPHLMFMAVGDVAASDQAPLQVSQFEADNRIIDQLTKIYLEGGGGGNSSESYTLPWYFAAMHTSIDCFEKRGKKGYLFTMGDEECPTVLTRSQIKRVTGDDSQVDSYSTEQLLEMVSKSYHVFHIVIEQGSHFRYNANGVRRSWDGVLGQRVLYLADYTKLSEVIVSTIQVIEGEDKDKVAASWGGDTSLVVSKAIGGLTTTKDGSSSTDVVRL